MKIALITDTHYGARKGSKIFHDYFQKFYDDIFFPTIKKRKIKHVIHLGDSFDNRKSIDFWALDWAKENVYDKFKRLKTKVYTIVGNHDAYYKNTNEVNAIDSLLTSYDNIVRFSRPSYIDIDGFEALLLPWVCQDNYEETVDILKNPRSKVAFGHLELNGFVVTQQVIMDHGFDMNYFKKFEKVFSGHFHTRSSVGDIHYLGNPYEMFWNDFESPRGFHIFDTETLEHTPINNPYRLFYKIFYEDTPYQTFDSREYEGKIVKLIVRKKTSTKKFEKFVDKLYASNVSEVKIVENFDFGGWYDDKGAEVYESEDTMSILNKFIDESEISLDKSVLQKMMQETYQEACELV